MDVNIKQNSHIKVVGIGQLAYDHVFTIQGEDIIYRFSRGGGTVGNILANLNYYKIPNMFVGVVGTRNVFGQRALDELKLLGTNIAFVQRVPTKNTLTIFQKSELDSNKTFAKHEFSTRCFICGGLFDWSTIPDERKYLEHVQNNLLREKISILFTDKATKPRMQLFRFIKQNAPQVKTLVDLGHIGYMRFLTVDRIVRLLEDVDILFLNESVAKFLQRRFRWTKGGVAQFIPWLMKTTPFMESLILTQGAQGLKVFFSDNNGSIKSAHFAAPETEMPIFSEGSGDALMAAFISQLHRSVVNSNSRRMHIDWVLIVQNALRSFVPVLFHLGARGHLEMPKVLLERDPLKKYKNKTAQEIKRSTKRRTRCPFCGQTNIERIGSDEISRRIRKIKNSNNFQESIRICRASFSSKHTYAVVGTGGSYAPAAFVTQLLLKKGAFASLYFPYQFLEFGLPVDWLLILSYSGKTRDYFPVIKHARYLGVKRIALITGNPKASLSRLLQKQDLLVAYETLPNLEKGFLSFSGVLLSSALMALALHPLEIDLEYVESLFHTSRQFSKPIVWKIAESLRKHQIIEIFWDTGGWPAFLDLETKLIESGIGAVIGHEFKNFSHGRFMFTMGANGRSIPKILLQTETNKYSEYLYSQLQQSSPEAPTLLIQSRDSGVRGALELLYRVNHLFILIAQKHKKSDVTKPSNIPKEGLALYRFSQQ